MKRLMLAAVFIAMLAMPALCGNMENPGITTTPAESVILALLSILF